MTNEHSLMMSAQRAIRGSLSRDEVHQLQLLATTSTNYLSHQRHAQRMETTGQDQADLRFQRTASDLEKSTLIDQYKESVPHLAGTSQSLLLIPKRRALPNLPGARPHQVQPSVNTRSPNSLSPGSPISLEDVPVHHLLENLIETRQRDVDWATLMTLVHQAQTYYAAQQRIDSVSMAPLQEQGSEANAASATSLAEIRQGDQPIHKQPYESAFQKKAPRVKHARRPPPPPVSAVPLAHIKRETASTSPPLKAVKGKRKASPAPAFRVRKARKVSTSMRRQLGPDPNRPGLLILKVKLPVDGSLYKTFTPGARQQSLQPSDALGAAAGQEHLGKAIASKTRPIDLTAISTKGNAVQVPSANPGGLSAFRTRINQTVTPHLKEGMSYLAKHQ